MRSTSTGIAVLVLFVLFSACGRSDGESTEHSFRVNNEDGLAVARTTGGPKFQEEIFNYEKILELRFDPENEESLLIRPRQLVMDSEGYIYVADPGNHRIAVFNPEGVFERSFGQEGQGPGDLFDPGWIHLHNDILIIPDSPRGRTSLFKTDGTFLDVLSYPRAGYRLRRLDKTSTGNLVLQQSRQLQDSEKEQWGERIIALSPSGDTLSVIDSPLVTLAKMVNAERTVFVQSSQSFARRTLPTPSYLHYTGYGQATFFPDREQILISSGEEPFIDWYNVDGEIVKRIHLDLPEQSVTKEERDQIIAAYDRQVEEAVEQPDERRRETGLDRARLNREILQLPETKAFWTSVIIDTDGYYWLNFPMTQRTDFNSNTRLKLRVLSPEGEYLGDTLWPPFFAGAVVYNGHLLGVYLDAETDEQIPVVYRIHSTVRGLRYP